MPSFDLHNTHQQIAAGLLAGGVALGAAVWLLLRSRRPSVEERERRRRAYLSREGRIIDGMVLDFDLRNEDQQASHAEDHGKGDFIFYQYQIAGVMYESSQEVTHLREWLDVRSFRVDLPASIRYDARNPANSILVSETWSGLRSMSPR